MVQEGIKLLRTLGVLKWMLFDIKFSFLTMRVLTGLIQNVLVREAIE